MDLRALNPSHPTDQAAAEDQRIWSVVGNHVGTYPYERIPSNVRRGGSGRLLTGIPVPYGPALLLEDSLDLVARQVARDSSGQDQPEVMRLQGLPYEGRGPGPGPTAGGGGGPGGIPGLQPVPPGRGGAGGPGGIPGMEPVPPGGGAGPGGIPGMEPVPPGAGERQAGSRPMLRLGSTGDGVRQAQELLVRHGATVEPDGQFGPRTQRAVIDFQRSAGLTPDGIVGPRTWGALEAG